MASPLFKQTNLETVSDEKCKKLAIDICFYLGVDMNNPTKNKLNFSVDQVFGYFVPLALWIENQKQQQPDKTVCIGLSLPEGAGNIADNKTLLGCMEYALSKHSGFKTATVSYDNFNLTKQDQD